MPAVGAPGRATRGSGAPAVGAGARATPAIDTTGLTRRFGRGADALVALDGLELSVARGEVLGLLGHNGAGKTTTVRLLNGVLRPSAGRARVLGLDPERDGPALRARCGVLTETPALDERLTARENLLAFARIHGLDASEAERRSERWLHEFGLAGRERERVAGYSRGMKQRLSLARALLHDPELIFLDEPTSGLDPVAAREVHELVLRFSGEQGRTVVLCTHNLVEAQRLCGRVALLQRGRLVALGTPEELGRRLERTRCVRIEVGEGQAGAALAAIAGPEAAGTPGAPVARRADDAAGADALELDGAGHDAVAAAVERLVRAGVRVHAVVPRTPSLEDVYFEVLGADAGPQRVAPPPAARGAEVDRG